MQRRAFLIQSGALISATMIAQCGMMASSSTSEEKNRRPHPNDFEQPIMKAIAFGMNAPNPHNTQAWKFRIVSDTEMLMYIDPKRLLLATDPPTRQIHIGCGCFLGVLKTGMTSLAYTTDISLFPEGLYEVSDTGKKPVARVRLLASDVAVEPFFNSIYHRKTNRLEYEYVELERALFDGIVKEISPIACNIHLIIGAALQEHLPVLYAGMEVECNTYRTYEESRLWFRENDKRIAEERDGINLPAGGTTGIMKFFAELSLKGLTQKDWHKKSNIDFYLKKYKTTVVGSQAIVQFVTPSNHPPDWVLTGMDYARFQLSATRHHFFLHPLSQVLQEFDEMTNLRKRYESLNGITLGEKIQMVARIGKAKEPFTTYRRHVKDMIEG